MPHNFSDAAIEVFPNINNLPTAPTASKAGNGSHLIEKHNSLIDKATDALDVLESQINGVNTQILTVQSQLLSIASKQRWKIVNGSYDVQLGEKLLINNGGSLTINVPLSSTQDLVPGFWFELLRIDNTVVNIGNTNIRIMGTTYNQVELDGTGESVSLIYVDDNIGWIPSKQNMLTLITSNPYGS